MKAPRIESATYFVIRADGSGEMIRQKPTFALVKAAIGCTDCDTVDLGNDITMIVDDDGWEAETIDQGSGLITLKPTTARKPVNELATKLYWSVCPGTTHQIAGDVVLVRDSDFA